jgi:hypothetical protein
VKNTKIMENWIQDYNAKIVANSARASNSENTYSNSIERPTERQWTRGESNPRPVLTDRIAFAKWNTSWENEKFWQKNIIFFRKSKLNLPKKLKISTSEQWAQETQT